jgi:predicted Zn-dependent protease
MAGGKMAIYTGLIKKLNATDDEIAQVMGHEISHALANHSAERMSVALASELAVTTISVMTESSAETTALTAAAAQVALTLPNSRTSEAEADVLGIEIAAKAGYNPNAAISLWQKMEQVSGSGGFEFLSTHPAPENRQEKLRRLIPTMMPYYQAAKK